MEISPRIKKPRDARLFRVRPEKGVLQLLNTSHEPLVATAAFDLVAERAQHVTCFCRRRQFSRLFLVCIVICVVHGHLNDIGAEEPRVHVTGVLGERVSLPCDMTPNTTDDEVSLVLWYKDDSTTPIYSCDARRSRLSQAHHAPADWLGHRAYLRLATVDGGEPSGALQLYPVHEEDEGLYRCRVDFRKARTRNYEVVLKVICKALSLSRVALGPPPVVTWWRESFLLDDQYNVTSQGISRNELLLPSLGRNDLMATFTCLATNNNISFPVSASVTVDLNSEALTARSGEVDFQHAAATADFIRVILRWWSIVNVKTPNKGYHHRNVYEEPMADHTDDPKARFLSAFITWLDVWEFYRHDTGVLTQETLSALRLSAQSLLALVKYCVSELHFKYVLLGKVQTDPLESRFGQYRQMAGGQYHISVRQLCETEGRIRLQNALPRMSSDDLKGIEEVHVTDVGTSCSVEVHDADLDQLRAQMPVIGYVGGYCAHAAIKVLKCKSCQGHLVITANEAETEEDSHSLITKLDRGGAAIGAAGNASVSVPRSIE
ncbi:hypothetical protein HPB50_017354 [Hyalomma asiaticum]|uniref:Uncharacterized protein n=1 Tax=Hyalomma asiaticum TaxID=266040 RepID=A0ACB7S744_HYAAI|nr:hypothetical protein HPB50_017354 [Hyalomma asiaticum]